MVRGSPNVRTLVAWEVDSTGRFAGKPAHDLFDLLSPPTATFGNKLGFEQAIRVEPKMDFPFVTLLVLGHVLLAVLGV